MILTVTLNPAMDFFAEVDRLNPGTVMRSLSAKRSPGGKGINTGRVLRDLGHQVVAAFLADQVGDDFSRLVSAEGLTIHAIATGRAVRTNVHVISRETGEHFKVNTPGEEMDRHVLENAKSSLEALALKASALILAGSLPPGLPTDAWATLARMGRRGGVTVAIDAEGLPLRTALDVPPNIVKINRKELAETLKTKVETMDQVTSACRELLGRGVSMVAITGHADETCLVTKEGCWLARPPRVATRRAVGAGDAFLAGLMHAHLRGLDPAETLRWAVACGTAVAHSQDYTKIQPEAAKALVAEVEVRTE